MKRKLTGLLLGGALVVSGSALAQDLSVRGDLSGNWFDPEQSGHGVQIEVINPREAVVAWYTFDPDGEPVWLFGVGDVEGDEIRVTLESFHGGRFPPAFDPDAITTEVWGEALLEFHDCESGEMSWTPERAGYDAGSMPLVRLTGIEGTRCGGAENFQRVVSFSLDAGPGPWTALFADYPVGEEAFFELESQWMQLPEPLTDRNGLMVSGNNHSDDLAMFFKAPVRGLQPETSYRVELEMTFATSVPRNCFGVGGSPGEGVSVKLGAAGVEPEQVVTEVAARDFYELNIDKGNQSQGGADALVVGDMTNSQPNCELEPEWQLKTVSTRGADFTATAGTDGTLWIYGGTDSAFEATTRYFVTDFIARLGPVAQ